ncbi:hypothetical protein GCM10020000_87580 [Streptomyces olivoverticillatus]
MREGGVGVGALVCGEAGAGGGDEVVDVPEVEQDPGRAFPVLFSTGLERFDLARGQAGGRWRTTASLARAVLSLPR